MRRVAGSGAAREGRVVPTELHAATATGQHRARPPRTVELSRRPRRGLGSAQRRAGSSRIGGGERARRGGGVAARADAACLVAGSRPPRSRDAPSGMDVTPAPGSGSGSGSRTAAAHGDTTRAPVTTRAGAAGALSVDSEAIASGWRSTVDMVRPLPGDIPASVGPVRRMSGGTGLPAGIRSPGATLDRERRAYGRQERHLAGKRRPGAEAGGRGRKRRPVACATGSSLPPTDGAVGWLRRSPPVTCATGSASQPMSRAVAGCATRPGGVHRCQCVRRCTSRRGAVRREAPDDPRRWS